MGSPVGVGDVSVQEAWARLAAEPRSALVDVRTRAEWTYVGAPDLSSIGKRVLLSEWQSFPDGAVDPRFTERLSAMLQEQGLGTDTELFFICRSGARSRAAALAMSASGFARCHNVADGFEGPLDALRHRGRAGGWKFAGLPWVQG